MTLSRNWAGTILLAAVALFFYARPAGAYDEVAGYVPETRSQRPAGVETFHLFMPLLVDTPRPSSEALILAAEEKGEIDAETSLLYQFYALYNDPRLPQAYHGDDRLALDSQAPLRAALRFDQLSGAGQQALLPYLIPPAYSGSWYEARRNGVGQAPAFGPSDFEPDPCIDLADGWTFIERYGFKVWLSDPAQMPTAEALVEELNAKVRPELHGLLGVTPLSDEGLECNGGSDSYDIYILPAGVMGNTAGVVTSIERGLSTCKAPSFMAIRADLPLSSEDGHTLFDILAHEYMHTMQRAYDFLACGYGSFSLEGLAMIKWFEATAVWATDFVYPDSNIEHRRAYSYLIRNNRGSDLLNDNGLFFNKGDYDAYLFPFYLTRQAGDDTLIRRLYESWETYALALEGVDQVVSGGLKARWPEFALYNLNRPPFDFYRQWDGIPHSSSVPLDPIEMKSEHPLVERGAWQQASFSGGMHRYARADYAQSRGLVVVTNMDRVVDTESIQLMHFPLSGEEALPPPQDFSEQKRYAICLEESEPDTIASLFVLSNSAIFRQGVRDRQSLDLLHLAMGCDKWRLQSDMLVETHWVDGEATWDSSIAVTASAIFSRTQTILNPGLYGLEFAAQSGQLEVAVRGTLQNRAGTAQCSVDFSYPVTPGDEAWLNVFIGIEGEEVQSGYVGQGITEVSGVSWRNCLGEDEEIVGPVDWFYTGEVISFGDGFAFSGNLSESEPLQDEEGTKTLTHSWTLTAMSE